VQSSFPFLCVVVAKDLAVVLPANRPRVIPDQGKSSGCLVPSGWPPPDNRNHQPRIQKTEPSPSTNGIVSVGSGNDGLNPQGQKMIIWPHLPWNHIQKVFFFYTHRGRVCGVRVRILGSFTRICRAPMAGVGFVLGCGGVIGLTKFSCACATPRLQHLHFHRYV